MTDERKRYGFRAIVQAGQGFLALEYAMQEAMGKVARRILDEDPAWPDRGEYELRMEAAPTGVNFPEPIYEWEPGDPRVALHRRHVRRVITRKELDGLEDAMGRVDPNMHPKDRVERALNYIGIQVTEGEIND